MRVEFEKINMRRLLDIKVWGVVLIMVASVILLSMADDNERCKDGGEAYAVAQEFVSDRLRAPSTAKFPRRSEQRVNVEYLGGCTHEIDGFVDATNGFGAYSRVYYSIKLRNEKGTKRWSLLEVKLED